MPDGDRFQWRLKGKGWRRVHKLLTSGADLQIMADAALKGVAAYLRQNSETPFDEFCEIVHEHLSRPLLFKTNTAHAFAGITELCLKLEEKVGECGYIEPALLAKSAALKTA